MPLRCPALPFWYLHTIKPPKVHRRHNNPSRQNKSPGYCTCLNGFTVFQVHYPSCAWVSLFCLNTLLHLSTILCLLGSVCLTVGNKITIDRCWEGEWRRPQWMLCYTVACLTDKRVLNLAVLLQRPPSSLAFRGAQGKQRASLCLQGPKGRWWGERDYCAGYPNEWHVFTLSLVGWYSGLCWVFLLKILAWEGMHVFKSINHKDVIGLIWSVKENILTNSTNCSPQILKILQGLLVFLLRSGSFCVPHIPPLYLQPFTEAMFPGLACCSERPVPRASIPPNQFGTGVQLNFMYK